MAFPVFMPPSVVMGAPSGHAEREEDQPEQKESGEENEQACEKESEREEQPRKEYRPVREIPRRLRGN